MYNPAAVSSPHPDSYLRIFPMKHLLVCLLLSPASLSLSPFAWASWGKFISTGAGTAVGTPSCAQVSTSHVVCAIRTGKSAIMVNEFNGVSWGKWTALVGTVSSDASCTSDGNGNVICAATASTGGLLWTLFNGTNWTTPVQLTASLFSAPSCADYTVGQVLCVARNASGGLAYTLYNGTKWSAIANLATTAISQPSCTTDNNAGVICAVYTSAGATEVNRYAAGIWQGFLNLGGIAGGAPDCTSMNENGNVVCFAEGIFPAFTATASGEELGRRQTGWATAGWEAPLLRMPVAQASLQDCWFAALSVLPTTRSMLMFGAVLHGRVGPRSAAAGRVRPHVHHWAQERSSASSWA